MLFLLAKIVLFTSVFFFSCFGETFQVKRQYKLPVQRTGEKTSTEDNHLLSERREDNVPLTAS